MDEKTFSFTYRLFNPNFWHVLKAFRDVNIRFIFLIGGSSSSKSYSVVQAVLLDSIDKRIDTLVFRKVGATIERTIFKDFETVIRSWKRNDLFVIRKNRITCLYSGSVIDFSGLDEPEKIKGISNYKRVVLEEISEFEQEDFKQVRKRLRGKSGQQIIAMLNPISEKHWFKTEVIDKEELIEECNYLPNILDDNQNVLPKEYSLIDFKWKNSKKLVFNPSKNEYEEHAPDMVVLKSNYLNNFWIIGSPDGKYGFYDKQVIADFEKDKQNDSEYYNVYALGNWGSIKTGGEFWKSFNHNKHVGKTEYVGSPIHLSIDNNVLPYISVSVWQIEEKDIDGVSNYLIKQIGEVAAKDPYNTVTRASQLTAKYLKALHHNDKVFVYGDQTTKSQNTIDEEKRSFFDKFCEGLEESGFVIERRMPTVNPSVSLSGEFVNEIYAGNIPELQILIDEKCKYAINDYNITKQDVNGGVLKKRIRDKRTGQSYEESGHFSDAKRYFIVEAFRDKYTDFSLRRNRSTFKDNDMKFYDQTKVAFQMAESCIRVVPDLNGIFIAIVAKLVENRIYITEVLFNKEPHESLDNVIAFANDSTIEEISFEAPAVWVDYAHELRSSVDVPVRILSDVTKKETRISAMSDFVRNNFYFPKDYDTIPEYASFIDNLYDSYKGVSIEAANILSGAAEYFKRKYPDLW